MNNKTIAAISTPLGPGGIGIVRVSGPGAYGIMKRLFIRKKTRLNGKNIYGRGDIFSSHFVYYGHLIDPDNGRIVDEVLAIYMKGPKSFTREDVVEFHAHSGFVVLDQILSVVVDAGAALAGPGEFSQRAFLSGRIDLTQAEAVIDLINAPCESAVQMASRQIAGGFREILEGLSSKITALQAICEANIEFFEDVADSNDLSNIQLTLRDIILPEISELIQRQKDTAIFKDGWLLAIAGVPNVGKSSLLNRLVERETAIVSEIPGTTRDIVREYFSINGVPVVVCDTAGIHDTKDPVECIGIQKAREHFQRADIVLLVLEGTRCLDDFEKKLVEDLRASRLIAIINKDDLANENAVLAIQKDIKGIPQIRVSAKTGSGIADLKARIFSDLLSGKSPGNPEMVTPNLRQRKILEEVKHSLQGCVRVGKAEQSLEVLSGMLKEVLRLLDEISGKSKQEDIYDHIFSQFCVGK